VPASYLVSPQFEVKRLYKQSLNVLVTVSFALIRRP
jgi:hypothetical protein